MSQHHISTTRYKILIGWDGPLQYFFGTVWDITQPDRRDEGIVFTTLSLPVRLSVCSHPQVLIHPNSGGELSVAGARNAGSHGHALSLWLSDGFLNRVRSIPFLMHAPPPLIRDKNRMR